MAQRADPARSRQSLFGWDDDWQYAFLVLASAGAAGLVVAFAEIFKTIGRAAAAIVIAAAVYWAATIPLWFYNDRYYLVLVPAAAIVLAIAPLPRRRLVIAAGFAMTLAMGLLSLGGTYAYQRGLGVILATRNELEREGVPRAAIDAGYMLNGEDLYRYPKHGIETMEARSRNPDDHVAENGRVHNRQRTDRRHRSRAAAKVARARSAWVIATSTL